MKFMLGILVSLSFLTGFVIIDDKSYNESQEVWLIDMVHEEPEIYEFSDEETCMALNIYHESRSENLAGKYAVADVVLNRVQDDRWPNTVCSVIYEAELRPSWANPEIMVPKRHRCQFSWYCDGINDEPKDVDAWNASLAVAYQIIKNETYRGITEGATHYHATYVNPQWNRRFHVIGRIGSHIFYRAD